VVRRGNVIIHNGQPRRDRPECDIASLRAAEESV